MMQVDSALSLHKSAEEKRSDERVEWTDGVAMKTQNSRNVARTRSKYSTRMSSTKHQSKIVEQSKKRAGKQNKKQEGIVMNH
jgi:hypothetical protein